MTERVKPLAEFFRTILGDLRKRLSPAEYQNLLEECDADSENEGTGADTISTPGQTPTPAD